MQITTQHIFTTEQTAHASVSSVYKYTRINEQGVFDE